VINVRPLEAGDETVWRTLWQGYLDFYKSPGLPETTTDATFDRLLNDERFLAFVAVHDGDVIGFVHCILHPVTWSTELACYLEDLYVSEDARGSGAGRALIEQVRSEAKKRRCDRLYWLTHESNARARELYDKLATLTGFVHYRVTL